MPLHVPRQYREVCVFLARGAALLLGVLALLSCRAQYNQRPVEVVQCANKNSASCAEARLGFQLVPYRSLAVERLVAAANRALGDLDFDTRRDDAQVRVSGDYLATVATHPKQLDELFRQALQGYLSRYTAKGRAPTPASVSALVEILTLPGEDGGAAVRLRLYYTEAGAEPELIDSVAPYQLFFSQLGADLGNSPD